MARHKGLALAMAAVGLLGTSVLVASSSGSVAAGPLNIWYVNPLPNTPD